MSAWSSAVGVFALANLLFPGGLLEQSSDCEQNSDTDCCSTGKYQLCTAPTYCKTGEKIDLIMHVFGSLTLEIVSVSLKSGS